MSPKKDPYIDLDDRTKAEIDLDLLPKDDTHPYQNMSASEAREATKKYLDAIGPPIESAPVEIRKRQALKEAYRANKAAENSTGKDKQAFLDQEKEFLKNV